MLDLVLFIMAITPSGAFSPGPLTVSTIALGSRRSWRAGLYAAAGHTAFELPYVAALTYVLGRLDLGPFKRALALAAFAFILFFAYLLLKDAWAIARGRSATAAPAAKFQNPLLTGVILTAFNPHFLLWWATVALPIVQQLASQPPHVFAIVYLAHVWMDYFWLALMASLGNAAGKVLNTKRYAAFLAALAALLLYFGVYLVSSSE